MLSRYFLFSQFTGLNSILTYNIHTKYTHAFQMFAMLNIGKTTKCYCSPKALTFIQYPTHKHTHRETHTTHTHSILSFD